MDEMEGDGDGLQFVNEFTTSTTIHHASFRLSLSSFRRVVERARRHGVGVYPRISQDTGQYQ